MLSRLSTNLTRQLSYLRTTTSTFVPSSTVLFKSEYEFLFPITTTSTSLRLFSSSSTQYQESQEQKGKPGSESESLKKDRNKGVLELNSLTNILIEAIKTTGPIPISSYMKQCLTNPEFGYYTTKPHVLGTSAAQGQGQAQGQGDFITSPEISSIFGETIGIWLYATWLLQQKPKDVQFIEFGPGSGSLMYDAIKVFTKLNKDEINLKIVMCEQSPIMRSKQFEKLCDSSKNFLMKRSEDGIYESISRFGNGDNITVEWVETEQDIVNHEMYANYIIAHEFFDALPIQQFHKNDQGEWREYLVDYNHTTNQFQLVLSPYETPSSMIPASQERFKNIPNDTRIEICPESYLYATRMSKLINSNKYAIDEPLKKGGMLIIDYGSSSPLPPTNTLRGIKDHRIVSPFQEPGQIDLSADVDFTNLSKIFTENGCISYGPVEQGDWLHELGIGYRVDQALNELSGSGPDQEKAKENLIASYKRLVSKDEMGQIYKFLGVLPGGSQGVFPVGFGGGVIEP